MEIPGLGSRNLARDDVVGGWRRAKTLSPPPQRKRGAGVCFSGGWRSPVSVHGTSPGTTMASGC